MHRQPLSPVPLILIAALSGCPAAATDLTIDLGEGVKIELVLVKKGTYRQGSPADEPGRGADETARQVTLSRDFYLGKFPVTRGQFRRFVTATGYRTEAEVGTSGGFGFDGKELVQRKEFTWRNPGFPQTDDHPVTLVTFNDANAFLTWLSKKAGRTFQLPTEAQREYACRAGTATAYFSGPKEEDAQGIAWYRATAGKGTQPVGKKKPNAWGLHDMSGNVWEWCRDWYGPYEPGPVTDPEQAKPDPKMTARRVLRGGSWFREARHCRSAARSRNTPGSRNADNGFRVMSLAEEGKREGPGLPGSENYRRSSQASEPAVAALSGQGIVLVAQLEMIVPLFILGVFVFIIFVVRSAVRSSRTASASSAADLDRVRVRQAEDGFWAEAPHLPSGTRLRYRCKAGDATREDWVTLAPGPKGTFVYTGGNPSDIVLLQILRPEEDDPLHRDAEDYLPLATRLEDDPVMPPPSAAEPFQGHPSAY